MFIARQNRNNIIWSINILINKYIYMLQKKYIYAQKAHANLMNEENVKLELTFHYKMFDLKLTINIKISI